MPNTCWIGDAVGACQGQPCAALEAITLELIAELDEPTDELVVPEYDNR